MLLQAYAVDSWLLYDVTASKFALQLRLLT